MKNIFKKLYKSITIKYLEYLYERLDAEEKFYELELRCNLYNGNGYINDVHIKDLYFEVISRKDYISKIFRPPIVT